MYVKRHYLCTSAKGKAEMDRLVAACPLTASTAAHHFTLQFMHV